MTILSKKEKKLHLEKRTKYIGKSNGVNEETFKKSFDEQHLRKLCYVLFHSLFYTESKRMHQGEKYQDFLKWGNYF